MKKHLRKVLSLVLVLGMAATLLAGCGSASSTTTSTASQAPADATGSSDAVVNYGLTTAWESLNPYGSASGSMYEHIVLDKLYDRLVYIRESGTALEPRAALSWESSEDGMSATFKLDPNCKWHDGEAVTASDWVYTAQLITNPEFDFGMKSEFKFFAGTDDTGNLVEGETLGIEAPDDYTLVLKFKSPTPVEDWILLHNKYFYVLPEHLLKDTAAADVNSMDLWANPVGSGPCTFISEVTDSQLQLGSFADYQLGAPKFGKLVYQVIAATNTVTSLMAGELDNFMSNPSIDDALAAEAAGVTVEKSALPTSVAVFLINNQNVTDKRVRQAMSYAIDKELLIEQSLQGQGVASATCIIPGSEWDSGIKWERNLDKAKELLADAGWDSTKVLKMAISSSRESMAAVIQQNLAEVGINIELQTVDVAVMFSGLQDGTYDLGICGSSAMNYPLWMQGYYDYRNATYCQISDPQFAELQGQIEAELDADKRKELVNQYQELLYDEMPLVMLYHGYGFTLQSDRLQGYNGFDGSMLNQAVWEWSIAE